MRITRTELAEIFKSSKIDGDCVIHFPCSDCGKMVDSTTHPKMAAQLINYFNEEVSRKLEGKIKIVIDDCVLTSY